MANAEILIKLPNIQGDCILGANWFAKLYSARFAMDSRFRGNDND